MGPYRDLHLSSEDPIAPFRRSGFAENFGAARRAALYTETEAGRVVAMGDALQEREEAIERATGKPFAEVWSTYQSQVPAFGMAVTGTVDPAELWRRRGTAEIERQGSAGEADVARRETIIDAIRASVPEGMRSTIPDLATVQRRAREIAREKALTAADIGERSDASGVLGMFAGGVVGTMQDPVNASSVLMGLPASSRILTTAIVEGVLGGVTEAIQQPAIQSRRADLGLDAGVGDALQNIGFGAAGGFVLGGSLKAGQKAIARLLGLPGEDARRRLDVLRSQDPAFRGAEQSVDVAAQIRDDNPGVPEALHRGRLDTAIEDAAQGRPARPAPSEPVRRIVVHADPATAQMPGFEVDEIQVDADLFQFKSNRDENGVVETLRGVEDWDPIRAGAVIFYEFEDGRRYIADGHQRVGLARRIKAKDPDQKIILYGHTLREADGVTPEDARLIAAMTNVAQADSREDLLLDAARVMRIAPDELVRILPPRSGLVRSARGLSNLDENGWKMAVNGVVDPNHAAAVGRLVPGDPDRQRAALAILARAEPENQRQAEAMIREVLAAPVERVRELSLFGEEEFAESLFLERAGVLDRVLKLLKRDRAVFGTLSREAGRIEAQGNSLNQDANVRRAEADAQAIQTIQTLANRRGPLSDALNDAARRVRSEGRYKGAVREFADAVRAAVERGDFEGATLRGSGSDPDLAADRTAGPGGSGAPAARGGVAEEHARLAGEMDRPGGEGQKVQSEALKREIDEYHPDWPDNLRDRVVTFARQVADLGIGDRHGRKQQIIQIGTVSPERAADIERILAEQDFETKGADFVGVRFILSEDEAAKILRDHGTELEAARGQVPLTPEDFAILPDVLRYGEIRMPAKGGRAAARSDAIEFRLHGTGQTTVIVRADIGQLAKRGGPRLRVLSMWKTKGGSGPGGADLNVREAPQPGKPTPDSDPQRTGPVEGDIDPSVAGINVQVEQTEAGAQILIEGIDPITDADRLAARADAALRGGDAAPPEGGLFDPGARAQTDLVDLSRQHIPIGERMTEDGDAIADVRSLADIEAEHDADLEFVDSLKLCGRDQT